MAFIHLPGVFLLIFFLSACASRQMTVRAVTDVISEGISAYESDDDLDLLEKAFPAHLKLLEALLASDPNNRQLLVLLSRAYASYAFIFFDGRIDAALLKPAPTSSDRAHAAELIGIASGYYRKGIQYAQRAIEIRYPDTRQQLSTITTAGPFIQAMEKEDLPALFWYGFNLSADINLNRESISAMAGAYRVEKAMQGSLDLDETYFHGMAHLVMFGYYAARSPLVGGNPALALGHYRRLKQLHGDAFLLTDLYFARYYLYHRQDREGFTQVLNRILSEPLNEGKFRLFNKVAMDRARIYLDATDSLFID
jgi:hypothetical protein